MLRQLHTLRSLSSTPKAGSRKKCSSLEPLHSNFDSNSQTSCKNWCAVECCLREQEEALGSGTHPYICNKSYLRRNELLEMRALFHAKGQSFLLSRLSAPFCSNKSTRLLVIVLNNNKLFAANIISQQTERAESVCLGEAAAAAARRECII